MVWGSIMLAATGCGGVSVGGSSASSGGGRTSTDSGNPEHTLNGLRGTVAHDGLGEPFAEFLLRCHAGRGLVMEDFLFAIMLYPKVSQYFSPIYSERLVDLGYREIQELIVGSHAVARQCVNAVLYTVDFKCSHPFVRNTYNPKAEDPFAGLEQFFEIFKQKASVAAACQGVYSAPSTALN